MKQSMTLRENVQCALNHQAGPVPLDFGATAVTGMHCTCVAALRKHYGLEQHPVKIHEPYQMLGLVEDDLLDALGADVVGIEPLSTLFGFPVQDWKPWRTPWGQDVLVPGLFNLTEDSKGLYIYPQGDTAAAPSGHLPRSGYFFDSIIRQPKLDEDNLRAEDNLEEFTLLTDEELEQLRTAAEKASSGGRAVVGSVGGTALGDIALVPAPFLKKPKGIRDIEEWYVSIALRKDYIHEVFARQTEIALENLAKAAAVLDGLIDVLFICGTDFGTQNGTFCSPQTFDDLWRPYYLKMNDWIHANTEWKTFKHCCGAVESFMPHFIDAGFDIINPVQCSASGMDAQTLKNRYGERLVFWGGGVDTQHVLPFGTPEEVRTQVLERCDIFSAGGGFVFNAIHNVQAGTPVENIVAMVEAVRKFNGS